MSNTEEYIYVFVNNTMTSINNTMISIERSGDLTILEQVRTVIDKDNKERVFFCWSFPLANGKSNNWYRFTGYPESSHLFLNKTVCITQEEDVPDEYLKRVKLEALLGNI